jgi:predicted acetyltransferase
MDVTLLPVKNEEKDKLEELLLDYEAELSGQREKYQYLGSYFEDPSRNPFFIMVNGEVAGFVLVNEYTLVAKKAKSISEFYVIKYFRNQGIGKAAAKTVFGLFSGESEIRELEANKTGIGFWKRVIEEYTNNNFLNLHINNEKWCGPVQIFNNV